jgi:hypothetical protein
MQVSTVSIPANHPKTAQGTQRLTSDQAIDAFSCSSSTCSKLWHRSQPTPNPLRSHPALIVGCQCASRNSVPNTPSFRLIIHIGGAVVTGERSEIFPGP